jgi:hypothetical protein
MPHSLKAQSGKSIASRSGEVHRFEASNLGGTRAALKPMPREVPGGLDGARWCWPGTRVTASRRAVGREFKVGPATAGLGRATRASAAYTAASRRVERPDAERVRVPENHTSRRPKYWRCARRSQPTTRCASTVSGQPLERSSGRRNSISRPGRSVCPQCRVARYAKPLLSAVPCEVPRQRLLPLTQPVRARQLKGSVARS